MARNHLRAQQTETSSSTWLHWKAPAFWVASGVLALLSWSLVRWFSLADARSGWMLLSYSLFSLVHFTLAISLERSIGDAPFRRAWRYRLAFLLSAGLGMVYGLFLVVVEWDLYSVWLVVFAGAGAFMGGLVVTAMDSGIWENNAPPPVEIQARVLNKHQQYLKHGLVRSLSKRVFDVGLSSCGLLLSAPLGLLFTFLIWFEDPGPILFVKNSVGSGGKNFHQFKFRTMIREAERGTGPVLAQERDARVLRVGRVLRKTALDELPQLVNILKGEMSFVGPRPQRTVLVAEYLERMPEYAERHRVLPGLAGLAQVAGDYYLTPRQKLRLDRLYIRYASLGFDLKLILLACLITFWYRWQKRWNGRLPRYLFRLGLKKSYGAALPKPPTK